MTEVRPDSLSAGFRAGFRLHPAGVAVVTGLTAAGPVGLTASSVASVSAAPPMLSFSVSRSSTSAAALVSSERLNVILLGDKHEEAARAFSTHGAPRFDPAQGWTPDRAGVPVLTGAPVTLTGLRSRVVPAGQSWLVLVDVTDVDLGPPGGPLVYYDRGYWSLGEPRTPARDDG